MPCCSRGTSGRPAEARVSSATSGEISRADGEEAYLGDDDEIGPPILDPDVVEGAGADGHPQVRCRIGEHLSHARAGLNGAQLLDGVDPIWVRKQCAGVVIHVCLVKISPEGYKVWWADGQQTMVKPVMPYFSISVLARGACLLSMYCLSEKSAPMHKTSHVVSRLPVLIIT